MLGGGWRMLKARSAVGRWWFAGELDASIRSGRCGGSSCESETSDRGERELAGAR